MKYDRIDLYNRYRDEVYLKHKEGNKYLLVHPSPYMRCGIIEGSSTHYSFVDGSGGPFLSVGSKLPVLKPDGIVENMIITSIYSDNGFIIELKDDISSNRTKAAVREPEVQGCRCGRVLRAPQTSYYCRAGY